MKYRVRGTVDLAIAIEIDYLVEASSEQLAIRMAAARCRDDRDADDWLNVSDMVVVAMPNDGSVLDPSADLPVSSLTTT